MLDCRGRAVKPARQRLHNPVAFRVARLSVTASPALMLQSLRTGRAGAMAHYQAARTDRFNLNLNYADASGECMSQSHLTPTFTMTTDR